VLRLFDGDLAARVERHLGITLSRSVSYLAAPAFAAAMVDRQVVGTIPVNRQVLLIADVPVGTGSELLGRALHAVNLEGETRVIALHRHSEETLDWSPPGDYALTRGDRLLILATRGGLGEVLSQSMPATSA
jgi:Trk K+ transport system NAD-binding subunit